MNPKTVIIAEIGENHVGDWDRARQMVAEAARAGADIVKFQSYRGADVAETDPERDWFAQVQLPDPLHRELMELAGKNGVGFLSSPFTLERARFLCEHLGLKQIKVASSEMLNRPLLDYLAERADEIFLSTGMADLPEIEQALSRLRAVRKVWLLHCVTQYPAEDTEANLRAIRALAKAFPGCGTGYSDHTLGIDAPVAAVALGAGVIEKHFTLSKSLPGTDHLLSATPEEFSEMVRRIRRLETLLGREEKRPVERELQIRLGVRGRWRKEQAAPR